jgi:hypothetical protein
MPFRPRMFVYLADISGSWSHTDTQPRRYASHTVRLFTFLSAFHFTRRNVTSWVEVASWNKLGTSNLVLNIAVTCVSIEILNSLCYHLQDVTKLWVHTSYTLTGETFHVLVDLGRFTACYYKLPFHLNAQYWQDTTYGAFLFFFFLIFLLQHNAPVDTTPDLCFVLHNDDGKGGRKMERRNVRATNEKRKLRK